MVVVGRNSQECRSIHSIANREELVLGIGLIGSREAIERAPTVDNLKRYSSPNTLFLIEGYDGKGGLR